MKKNLLATLRSVDIDKIDEEFEVTRYTVKRDEEKSISKRFNKLNKQHTRRMESTKTIL